MSFDRRANRRSARKGAKATGPKIDRLDYARCPGCNRPVIFDSCARKVPACPHCGSAVR